MALRFEGTTIHDYNFWPMLHQFTDNLVDNLASIIRVENVKSSQVSKNIILMVETNVVANFIGSTTCKQHLYNASQQWTSILVK